MHPRMTQTELAEIIGITPGFLAHIETGRSRPSLENTIALSKALGVAVFEMLYAAGRIDSLPTNDDTTIKEPELRMFFSDYWPRMPEDEKELFRQFMRIMKMRDRDRQSEQARRLKQLEPGKDSEPA